MAKMSILKGLLLFMIQQVMVGIYGLCAVWGEPLAQTAQSFMPPLIYGSQKNLKQVISLLTFATGKILFMF